MSGSRSVPIGRRLLGPGFDVVSSQGGKESWPPPNEEVSMKITIETELLESLTYRGILALVAATALGDGQWTTAQLSQAVSCNASLMLEGMGEIHTAWPEFVGKQVKTKWPVGTGVASEFQLQVLDSAASRRKDFLDDVKAIFEWGNKGLSFTMNASDGQAVQRWLKERKDWTREMWRTALRNRFLSEGIIKSQPIHLWLGRLVDYLEAPLDRYGKTMVNGGGKVGEAITREQSNNAARQQAVADAGRKKS